MNFLKRSISTIKRISNNITTKGWFLTDKEAFDMIDAGSEYSGEHVTSENASYHPTVFACTRLLADSVSVLPVTYYEVNEEEHTFKKAKDKSLYDVLSIKPNFYMTAFDYWRANMWSMLYRGRAISYKSRNGSRVLELIPIDPATIEMDIVKGELVFTGKARWHTNQYFDFKNEPADNFFWYDYATDVNLKPLSPVAYQRNTIGLGKSLQKHNGALMKNNATPSGVIETDLPLEDPAKKNLAKSWRENHGGGKRGGVAILDEGMKFKSISMTNEDAQFLETMRYNKEDLCGIYGVSPSAIGDTARAQGWSTLEYRNIEFLKYTLNPYLTRVSQAAMTRLVPENEKKNHCVAHDVNEFLKADSKARADYYEKMFWLGAMNSNEIMIAERRNPRKGGDDYYIRNNLVIDSNQEGYETKPTDKNNDNPEDNNAITE